eukprot:CAMPEP_0194442810 /NCGR_PEP_ID=MMETSP0176-20130528/126346_1 /TAXON_ID=216777 /ORGANISM="Proboscia alata, Strain PI-D3" /LENGTH=384 /DNA_ID=CAMNT_0039268967 /DNA_START=434 /DNA_END=1585 /DNA_ORIENTATION=-
MEHIINVPEEKTTSKKIEVQKTDSGIAHDTVVKLTIGKHESPSKFSVDSVRRVAVKRLINSENHMCYFNLAKLAVLYSPDALSLRDGEQKTVNLDEWKITTTYVDSDGDRITFSSDMEFIEAFTDMHSNETVFRVRAEVTKKINHEEGWKVKQSRPVVSDAARSNCNQNAFADENKKLDPCFIHVRHTCDNCDKSPIIGIRYHACNIPNYDLCQECMEVYPMAKNPIVFKPEQLDRDMRFNRCSLFRKGVEKSMREIYANGRCDQSMREKFEQFEKVLRGMADANNVRENTSALSMGSALPDEKNDEKKIGGKKEDRKEETSLVKGIDYDLSPLSPDVLSRWGVEILQLHDLGFLNDRKSVEALESLYAANIGVDSSDQVTIEK